MIENTENLYDSGVPIDLTAPQVKAKAKPKRRSSFFNLAKPENEAKAKSNEALAKYRHQQLETEESRWVTAYQEAMMRDKRIQDESQEILDASSLPPKCNEILAQAIDVKKFCEESEAFTKRAKFYIAKKEWIQKRLNFCHEQLGDRLEEIVLKEVTSISSKRN